jgi:hypothetical protein
VADCWRLKEMVGISYNDFLSNLKFKIIPEYAGKKLEGLGSRNDIM